MSEFVIRTDNLTRDFETVRALDGLSFEVPSGIVFGFLGSNGAGKTTTIRLLLGLLEPSGGNSEVLGYDIRSQADEIRIRTGALLEHTGLYERLSAEENLEYYGRIWRLPAAMRKDRIKELLSHFNLWERRREKVGTWSRGMKQKIAVARAILHHPQLVFLDEPTAGLDPVAASSLREDIVQLASCDGATVFLTTHNLNEAEKICDRVAVINRGKLVTIGHPDELRNSGSKSRIRITGAGFTEEVLSKLRFRAEIIDMHLTDGQLLIDVKENIKMSPLIGIMIGEGVEIEEIKKEKASLEEVFLKLMEEEE